MMHRWSKRDPETGRLLPVDARERFFNLVRKTESGCWLWLGSLLKDGYGCFSVSGRTIGAHRWAFANLRGEKLDRKLVLDHLCRNPACANPWHLEQVTSKENTLRGIGHAAVNSMKVRCIRGHAFTPENTYIAKSGKRQCRECWPIQQRERYAKKKQAVQ